MDKGAAAGAGGLEDAAPAKELEDACRGGGEELGERLAEEDAAPAEPAEESEDACREGGEELGERRAEEDAEEREEEFWRTRFQQ